MRVPHDSIRIGKRDRTDLGDLAELAESIAAVGLLHPIVVTEDMSLVAGGRRLAAVRLLGWAEVPVTVVDLSSVAGVLQAEADENTCRKALTPYEASRARERRAQVLADDAKRRQAAAGQEYGKGHPKASSKLDEAKPSVRATRKAGAVATGYSGSTLDKVDRIRDVAERGVVRQRRIEVPAPEPVREVATKALEDVKLTGAAVDRAVKSVEAAIDRYVPKSRDDIYREWRRNFLAALGAGRRPLQFTADAVVESADAECLDEFERWVADVNRFAERVRAAGTPAKVIQFGGR